MVENREVRVDVRVGRVVSGGRELHMKQTRIMMINIDQLMADLLATACKWRIY